MNLALWIVAGLLAVAYLGGGAVKLIVPKAKFATFRGAGWADDFSAGGFKTIGALEALAAVGLILPAVLDIATVFVPSAALGLVLLMTGARSSACVVASSSSWWGTWLTSLWPPSWPGAASGRSPSPGDGAVRVRSGT